jgi:glycerol-3-phosphate dehydrogenase
VESPYEELTAEQSLRLEPALNPRLLASFLVPDGTFDPLRLATAFAASAKSNGARFKLFTEVEDLIHDGKGDIIGVKVWQRKDDKRCDIRGDIVVNATGAWVGEIAKMAGVNVNISPTPGIMVAYDRRLCERTINRLNSPSDGDIVLPQRRMMVVGTTSFAVDDADYVPVEETQIRLMLERGSELIPALKTYS